MIKKTQMKNNIKIQLGFLFLFLIALFSFSGKSKTGKLTQQLDAVCERNNFNGSVAVFDGTVQVYRKNKGFSDFSNKTKINKNTMFAIGSISKQFTAVLILLQMEQNRLNLDDKVSEYVKEFQTKEYESITIRQLLNHTSGLNTLGGKLMFKSGTGFYYSNDGYNTLGRIIEKTSGKSYNENLLKVFKKAGMTNSSTGSSFNGGDFGLVYVGSLNRYEKVRNMPERLNSSKVGIPAGGILSTVDDLLNWNQALYGGRIIKPKTLELLTTQSSVREHSVFGKTGYGLGIMRNTQAPVAYFHSGYVKGAPSLLVYYPKTKISVIILSNIADESKQQEVIFRPHIEIKEITDGG
ncbi:serine hydrolase [Chryseobacterium pennae]|uniref:Serine hydrolase n=2 Tax=Chryseobacterium pennae TaxID=2258962 RepID=A0A3D9CB99_9FLAO|nr:serine hydrolase [Chryseobacterium pennae]